MKLGRSLSDIAAELDRQSTARVDYIAPQRAITAETAPSGALVLTGTPGGALGITNHAHGQLSDHLGIPKKYYDRMRVEAPDLLARNVNEWLHKQPADKTEEKRMLRTLDGNVRAFLSPKYRPLDNYDLASAVLPLLEQHHVRVQSAELTETRMFIKGILTDLSDDEPVDGKWADGGAGAAGHHISDKPKLFAAITISNSDVGAGTLRVEPSVFTVRCTNFMILAQAAMKKYHIGRAFSADEGYEVFRDETRKADDTAFWLKVQDVTRAAFNPDLFRDAVAQIRKAAGMPIVSNDLPKVVELTVEKLKLPERSANSILSHLARGGELTQWGLSAAITASAESIPDLSYEDATAFERAGGEVITLSKKDWAVLAEAA